MIPTLEELSALVLRLGDLQLAILLATVGWVLVLVLMRYLSCSFWRRPENDRRQHQEFFDGDDRRRCKLCNRRDSCQYGTGCQPSPHK